MDNPDQITSLEDIESPRSGPKAKAQPQQAEEAEDIRRKQVRSGSSPELEQRLTIL